MRFTLIFDRFPSYGMMFSNERKPIILLFSARLWALRLERVMGIEPTYQPWEGRILPMNYTRATKASISHCEENFNSLLQLHEKYPALFAVFCR